MTTTTTAGLVLPTDTLIPLTDSLTLCADTFPKYVEFSWAGGSEIMRLDECPDDIPLFTRAQGGTLAQAFPKGTCVTLVDAPAACGVPSRITIPALPDGNKGDPYEACVTIPGLLLNYKIQSYNAPEGVEINLLGDELCLTSKNLLNGYTAFPIRVVLGDKESDDCPDILLVGTLTAAGECICVPISYPGEFSLPSGQVGEPYETMIPFTGSLDGVELVKDTLPEGIQAQIVGNYVRVHGVPVGRFEEIIIALKNDCSCDPVAYKGSVTITAACNDGCTYYWSMSPTVTVPGGTVVTHFTPPKGCPPDTTLSLDVFKADGVTPYIVPGTTDQLVLTIPPGGYPYVTNNDDANSNLVFKPSAEQQRCLSCCSPSITRQRRIVLGVANCGITLNVTNQNITTAGVKRSYSIESSTGCAQAQIKIDGTLNGVPYSVTNVVTLPYYFTDAAGSLAGDVVDATVVVTGIGACAGQAVCGSPIRLRTNVPSGPPVTSSVGGRLSVVAGDCGVAVGAPCVSLATCVFESPTAFTSFRFANVPPGGVVSLEVTTDGGVVWSVPFSLTSAGLGVQDMTSINVAVSCPAVTLSGGVATITSNPDIKYRMKYLGSVISSCI